jgi:hypothetical protein
LKKAWDYAFTYVLSVAKDDRFWPKADAAAPDNATRNARVRYRPEADVT